jgi:hypothetical protein
LNVELFFFSWSQSLLSWPPATRILKTDPSWKIRWAWRSPKEELGLTKRLPVRSYT